MAQHRIGSFVVASLVLCAGTATALQPSSAPGSDTPPSPPPGPEASKGDPTVGKSIRFSFKDAPIDQVIDTFSREAGLPVIREVDLPGGAITFLSASAYDFDESLRVLNVILGTRGLHLRRDGAFMYLGKRGDIASSQAFPDGVIPEDVPDSEVVTIFVPLNNAGAASVAEQLKPLVSNTGSMVALPPQNALVIAETAERARRLRAMIDAIDAQAPFEESVKVFKLKHVRAEDALKSLKVLVSEKQVTVVFDQQGNRRTVRDENLTGVRLEFDGRTNSIIALGGEGRLSTLEQLIAVLDVPAGGVAGGGREMATFTLGLLDANAAARDLAKLYERLPNQDRPTILPLPDAGKITVIGATGLIAEAAVLLNEIDGGGAVGEGSIPGSQLEMAGELIPLEHVDARGAVGLMNQLLTPRQQRTLRIAPAPTGSAVVISGPPRDVEAARALVRTIDRPADRAREARLVVLDGTMTRGMVDRALKLGELTGAGDAGITVIEDADAVAADGPEVVTLLGSREALGRFDSAIAQVRGAAEPRREARTFTLENRAPSSVVSQLNALTAALLRAESVDGEKLVMPSFDAIDELGMVVVRAQSDQFEVVRSVLSVVDTGEQTPKVVRVVRLRTSDPQGLIQRAMAWFEKSGEGLDPWVVGEVETAYDAATGNLVITADEAGMARFVSALEQAERLLPPERETKLIDLNAAEAGQVIAGVRELLEANPVSDPGRELDAPVLSSVERTNSVMVTADPLQMRVIEAYIRRLDVLEPTELPPLKLIQVRAADAPTLARTLMDQYNRRPSELRRDEPVDIRADVATNTLIVSAHIAVLPEIEAFVEDLNTSSRQDTGRVTEIFPLKVARAQDVASAMSKLYPEPPIPRDRRGNPMPWLAEPREVNVSADAGSNALIVDAPAERMPAFKALVAELDRVELPPQAELRTYAVTRGDLNAVASTLRQLAQQGVLNAPAQAGGARVPVTIESEPVSGTLIVAGDGTTHSLVERVLERISSAPVERDLRVLRIENADPREVADRALAVYAQQTAGIDDAPAIDVSADASSNSLLIVAEAEGMARFLRIVEELEQQSGPPRELRLIELQHAQALEMVAFLTELVETSKPFSTGSVVDPVFEAIERTNTLLVAAQPEQHEIVRSLVRSLDVPQDNRAGPLRILRLRTADANNVAQVLNQAFGGRPSDERAAKPVSIRPDGNTNTLIVSAHPDVMPEVERLVSELNDAQSYDSEGREIRIFPLRVARAEELANTIDQMFPQPPMPVDSRGRPLPNLREPKEVFVRADRQTNSLIVDAPAKRLAGFEQLVEQLDRAKVTGDRSLRTYRIARADLNAVATTLRRLAESGGLVADGATQAPVIVEIEPVSRTLVVSGPQGAFVQVEQVIESLEGASAMPETELLFLSLTNARAERVRGTVETLLGSRARELAVRNGAAVEGTKSLVEVVADGASNTLLVTVPTELTDVARELIARLDTDVDPAMRSAVRVLPLRFADAGQTASALERTVSSAEMPSGELNSLTISAAASGSGGANALIVSGPEVDIEYLRELIEAIDRPSADENLAVRTIFLEHNRASTVARVVEGLIQGEQLDGWMRFELMRRNGRGAELASPPKVASDDRLNAVIVTAPPAMIAVAEEIILQLDRPADASQSTRSVRIITLANSDASAVAANLNAVLGDEPGADGERMATIRVDAASNSLIVRGSDKQLAEIQGLAAGLDGAALVGTRQLRTISVDRSRTDAASLALTLQRLLSREGGPKVEVITTEELLRRQAAPADEGDADPEDSEARHRTLVPKNIRLIIGFTQTVVAAQADEAPASPETGGVDVDALLAMAQELFDAEQAEGGAETDGASGGAPTLASLNRSDATPEASAVEPAGLVEDDEGPGEITIAVDPETNALVVVGSSRATQSVIELAERLQSELPVSPNSVRVVRVPSGSARRIGGLLSGMTRQMGIQSDRNPSGLTGRTIIITDEDSDSLIVSANDADFEVIGRLVVALTAEDSPQEVALRVYPLASVPGDRAARVLQDFLSPNPRGRQAQLIRDGQPLRITVENENGDGTETIELRAGDVNATAGPSNTSMIVVGPAEAMALVDRFVELIDQSPVSAQGLIQTYVLEHADAPAAARAVQGALAAAGRVASVQGGPRVPDPTVLADTRINALIVTGSVEHQSEAKKLIAQLDMPIGVDRDAVTYLKLEALSPSAAKRIIDRVILDDIKRGPGAPEVTADDALSVLVVRADEGVLAEIRGLLAEIDRTETADLPVRTIVLERADAGQTASALQRLYDDRARVSTRPGERQKQRRVAIIGDRASGTLVVAASEGDFEQVQALAEAFDREEAGVGSLEFKVIRLEHARVSEIGDTVRDLANELQWGIRNQRGGTPEQVTIQTDPRSNAIIVLGTGEAFETVDSIVASLDVPAGDAGARTVRVFKIDGADLGVVQRTVQNAFEDQAAARRWWEPSPPDALSIEIDGSSQSLIVVGPEGRLDAVGEFIDGLRDSLGGDGQGFELVNLSFGDAQVVADSLNRFFRERARMSGSRNQTVTAVGQRGSTSVLVTGSAAELALAVDIATRLDEPEGSAGRRVEVYALENGEAADIARAVQRVFPRSRTTGQEPVVVTPDVRTNAVIVSAPGELYPEVEALVQRLDTAPAGEIVELKRFTLANRRADEVATILRDTLGLDAQGRATGRLDQGEARKFLDPEGNAIDVRARITADTRSNTLLVSADALSMTVISPLVVELDDQAAVSPREYRVIPLEHKLSRDIALTLQRMMRSATRAGEAEPSITSSREDNALIVAATTDQFREIDKILGQLDTPDRITRTTEFVALEFAEAEQVREALAVFYGPFARGAVTPGSQSVSITADPASNSLVISAGEDEWAGIRELIGKLDREEYDASRRLEVIVLKYTDATSVARAVQAAFDAPLRAELERERNRSEQQQRNRGNRNDPFGFLDLPDAPAVLVSDSEVISVSAEPVTNSLIVSAGKRDMERVRSIVERLDVSGSTNLPEPRVIALRSGKATDLASSLMRIFSPTGGNQGSNRGVMIVGDEASNALIVRSTDEEFTRIRDLAESLQDQASTSGMTVRVVRLGRLSATRLAQTVQQSFQAAAEERGEALAVRAERGSNALVVASSLGIFEEIERLVRDLDGPDPDGGGGVAAGPVDGAWTTLEGARAGQVLSVIDLANSAPNQIVEQLEGLGLTREPSADGGLVAERITVVAIEGRQSVAVQATESDMRVVRSLISKLDRAPIGAEQRLAIVPLKVAEASRVVEALERVLDAESSDTRTDLAVALGEQVRRLNLPATSVDGSDLRIDLDVPLRLEADAQTNSVVIASTPGNVRAVRDLIGLLDRLPVGDAVIVRIFHLSSAPADRIARVVRELFAQGEGLRRAPGTELRGLPTTETGKALAGEVALTIDDRTNAIIVAGREEAVALAEVLITQLDSSETANWIESRLVALEHADAARVVETIDEVLVRGMGETPDSVGLQRQVGRLRMLRSGDARIDGFVDSRIYAPMTTLKVLAEENLNAVIVIGARDNIEVVQELIGMLDVEAASRDALVRVYPLEHASADRVAGLLDRLFREQVRSEGLREQDAAVIQADPRTNALVIATSPRSFGIVEGLLKTLDTADVNPTVSLTVVSAGGSSAADLAPKVERLMRDRLRATSSGEASPRDIVSIQPIEGSNALLVAASEENLTVIRELVEVLNGAEASLAAAFEVFPLRAAQAGELVEMLDELYVDEINRTRGQGTLTVRADQRLNAVVASGSPADIEALRSWIERLDGDEFSQVREINIIPLKSANARETVDLLNDVLSGRSIAGGRSDNAQGTILRFARKLAEEEGETIEMTETELSQAIRGQVSIEADTRTNSIFLNAPPSVVKLIRALIDHIDDSAEGSRRIRIFELENADAAAMRELLQELFELDEFILAPVEGGAAIPAGLGDSAFSTTPDPRRRLSITVDNRTNTLVVSGTPDYMERAEEVIRELDRRVGSERVQKTIELKNAPVEEVAGALQRFITLEQDRIARALGPDGAGSVIRQLEREISVVGVPGSSRLILSASPRYMETVQGLIEELDRAPAQVLIQVLLAEVTLDTENTWGVDLDVGPFGGDDYVTSTTGLATGVLGAVGVPNLAVASLDFDLMVRALQVQGRLEVLSRPQILVNDNQRAVFNVGEDIQVIQGTSRATDGSVSSSTETRTVGVILDVTPSISPDGFVRLDVAPEISALTQRTTQISEDFEAPVISVRSADTTVTVRDGETIVLGGLIQNTAEARKSRVPLLADIPFVGEIFKTELVSNRKTELLIILTPRVIQNDTDLLRYLSVEEIDRLSVPEGTKIQMKTNDIGRDARLSDDALFSGGFDEPKPSKPVTPVDPATESSSPL